MADVRVRHIVEYNGDIYYVQGELVYDEHFITVPKTVAQPILEYYEKSVNLDGFDREGLISYMREKRVLDQYARVIEIYELGVKKFGYEFERVAIAIMTSLYRQMNKPEKAIEMFENYRGECSVALLTSVAAAYCDIGRFDIARKYANMANARSHSSGKQDNGELASVYMRINKMEK